jgi:hypothetical protein
MKPMTSPTVEPADLLDLKLLPAWVKEPAGARNYGHYTGEEETPELRRQWNGKGKRSTPARRSTFSGRGANLRKFKKVGRDSERASRAGRVARREPGAREDRHHENHPKISRPVEPPVAIRFLPYLPAFENVVAQIKSGSVAYSLFVLARLFLEKPERYEVCLTTKAESPLYRLGDNGAVSLDREFLERNAFRLAHGDFYEIDIAESDPIKGNFSNVARCRLSGTLLGPTNHHNYQSQLRSLYEQRFGRRMSFADYQRQVEIVNDATLIERWKEEARRVTTYKTSREEVPLTFPSAVEAERHFRSHYLPELIRSPEEVTIGGVVSRRLPDRILNRAIEDAWARESHSPSNTMQELASRFRQKGLHVFRHRRGMLFVSPIRVRPFVYEQAGVSPSVNAILEAVAATAGINRKHLFEKLIGNIAGEDAEPRKLALASDLHWLINEGYVIEFSDGALDLPRGKTKSAGAAAVTTADENLVPATSAAISQSPTILSTGSVSPS